MKKVLLLNNQGATYGVPLSLRAVDEILRETGINLLLIRLEVHCDDIIERDSPVLIKVVEKLGADAFDHIGHEVKWRIVEIPDYMKFEIAFRDNGDEILYDARTSIEPDFGD